jgi:hypothetical protein
MLRMLGCWDVGALHDACCGSDLLGIAGSWCGWRLGTGDYRLDKAVWLVTGRPSVRACLRMFRIWIVQGISGFPSYEEEVRRLLHA